MEYDNPARRLHDLLTRAFTASKTLSGHSSNYIWTCAFGLEFSETALLCCNEELMLLLKASREAVSQLKTVRKQPYILPINYISRYILQHGFLNVEWSDLMTQLSDANMMAMLEMTANILDEQAQLVKLEEEKLTELLNDASALLEEARNSDLESDIKIFLVARLEEICQTIKLYSASGSEGLRRAVEANLGAVILRTYGAYSSGKTPAPIQKFVDLMLKCGGLLGLAVNTERFVLPAVAKAAQQLLPGD